MAGVNQQNSRWLIEILVPSFYRFSTSVVTDISPCSFLSVFCIFLSPLRNKLEVTPQSTHLEAASKDSLEEEAA